MTDVPPPLPSPFLLVVAGLPYQVCRPGAEGVVVGRAPDSGWQLDHPEISRHHCEVRFDEGRCVITDLASKRGTLINGAAINAPTPLAVGDRIALGPVILLFGIGEPPAEGEIAVTPASLAPVLFHGSDVARIPLADQLSFGRGDESDVVLADSSVSRRHAVVQKTAHGFLLTDLRSTAGSFVNGRRFDKHELVIGDRIRIGPFQFEFDGSHLNRIAAAQGGAVEVAGVTMKVGALTVLDTVSLTIAPSHFHAIIGPSGAGKSSLLHVVSGQHPPTAGQVLIDGADAYAASGPQSTGFVPQDDIVHRELTVAEALQFSAELRLRRGTPELELRRLVLQTLDQLGLRERAGTRVGSLSGGQRKRVSVGAELLAKPRVLFLDEPTSGLDPATEFKLMELLRDLAVAGCTIVCTTHVMENVYLVDELTILSKGKLVFAGTPQEARAHFGVQRMGDLYEKLEGHTVPALNDVVARERRATKPAAPRRDARPFALPILLRRMWAILRSDWKNFAILAGQPIIIAALISWVSDDASLLLFFAYIATLWFGTSNAAQEIVREIPIFRRERVVGVPRWAYLLSKFIFLGGTTLAQAALLYGALLLFEGGLGGAAFWQCAGLAGIAFAAVGIGCAISALARTVMQAVLIVPLVLIPLIVLSGHPVAVYEMKPAVRDVAQLTPTFASQALMDTSFLWRKEIARDTLSDHWTSFRNLNVRLGLKTGETYVCPGPGLLAMVTLALWALGGCIVAWIALKFRERT